MRPKGANVRYLVSVLLVAAGVAAILADRQRWWPACATDLDSDACVTVQSDQYDFAPPSGTWEPIGSTAHLMGLSLALMALAVIVLARVALPPRWWSWPVGVVCAVPFGLLAADTLASAAAGRPAGLPWTEAAFYVLAFLWPLAVVALGAVGSIRAVSREWAFVLAAGLLALASPVLLYLTATALIYYSHDTPPWTETLGGVLTVLAGAALLLVRTEQHTGQAPEDLPRRFARA